MCLVVHLLLFIWSVPSIWQPMSFINSANSQFLSLCLLCLPFPLFSSGILWVCVCHSFITISISVYLVSLNCFSLPLSAIFWVKALVFPPTAPYSTLLLCGAGYLYPHCLHHTWYWDLQFCGFSPTLLFSPWSIKRIMFLSHRYMFGCGVCGWLKGWTLNVILIRSLRSLIICLKKKQAKLNSASSPQSAVPIWACTTSLCRSQLRLASRALYTVPFF